MRIAQVSPLYESVPPKGYGGTERVVAYLTDELVALGHDVTLFASADSKTSARLVPACPGSLRLNADTVDGLAPHIVLLELVSRQAPNFDLIHFHLDYLHYPFTRRGGWRTLTTLHGRLDIPDLWKLYDEYREMPVVSISDAQRRPLPHANWQGTVHHGVPLDLFRPGEGRGGYLAFLGRVSPEKRVDRAIEIARRTGLPIRIAAKVDRTDREYFESSIRPLFDLPFVDFLGEIGEHEKQDVLGNALALLFPIDWAEPFGMVMIESMACGTPVIAWRHGSVSEVMLDGVTGFVVEDLDEAVAAVGRLPSVSRRACRETFERRYTAPRMAADYVRLYEALMRRGGGPRRPLVEGQVA